MEVVKRWNGKILESISAVHIERQGSKNMLQKKCVKDDPVVKL